MELTKVLEDERPGESESDDGSIALHKIFEDEDPHDDNFSVAHTDSPGLGAGEDGEDMADYNKAHREEERKTLMSSITSKAAKYLRMIVYLVVLVTTVVCCLLVYHFTRSEEENNFKEGFSAHADKMAE